MQHAPALPADDPHAPGSLCLGDYLAQWLGHVKGRVRPRTYEGYEGVVRLYVLPGLGGIGLERLHPLHLQGLYAELTGAGRNLSGGTVLNLHLVMTQALGQAVRWGMLSSNPAHGAQPPRARRAEHP